MAFDMENKADYLELVDAWWKSAEALEALPGAADYRVDWHSRIFETVLRHCGWTVEEWNNVVEAEKAKGTSA
jgi:hypothetical protein